MSKHRESVLGWLVHLSGQEWLFPTIEQLLYLSDASIIQNARCILGTDCRCAQDHSLISSAVWYILHANLYSDISPPTIDANNKKRGGVTRK